MWSKLLIFLVAGYLAMTRSFAYLGIPPAKIFIGEIVVTAFLIARPRAVFDRWLLSIGQPSIPGAFALALSAFLSYGVFEFARGLQAGYPPLLALEGFAFHYYPVWFFVGLWAGSEYPGLLVRVVRAAAWANGVYGLLFILFLSRVPVGIPGTTDVPLFGQPAGSALVVLGLLCLEPQISRVWYLLLLNLFVLIGVQVRAEYLGFLVGLALWAVLTRRFDKLFAGCALVAAFLLAGYVSDFRIPSPQSRGGEISTRDIMGRVLAPFDLETAEQYAPDAVSRAGTVEWRERWWAAIWETIHEHTETALIGEGYGYPISELVGYKERDIRTPHSVFFYSLCYGGWIGVGLFLTLQLALAHVLGYAWRFTGVPFGLVIWAAFLSGAFFGNAYETPFGAIPFYLLTGLAAAPVLFQVPVYARSVRAQLLSPARG